MQRRGITLTTQVLGQSDEPRPKSTPPAAPRGEAARIVRLRFFAEGAVSGLDDVRPLRPLSRPRDENLTECSLYALLRDRYGLAIARGERRLKRWRRMGARRGCWTSRSASPLLLPRQRRLHRGRGGRSNLGRPATGIPHNRRGRVPQRRTTRRSDRDPRTDRADRSRVDRRLARRDRA
jgi:hypothetical protein